MLFEQVFEKRVLPEGYEKFKPMLSAKFDNDVTRLVYPLLASPKIDGIRCVVMRGNVLTRTLKTLPNAHVRAWLLELARTLGPTELLDGELVALDEDGSLSADFQRTTSAVMKRTGTPRVAYCVFDRLTAADDDNAFAWRIAKVADPLRLHAWRFHTAHLRADIRPVEHVEVHSAEELALYEQRCLAQGYEGVMLRDPDGRYKFGRSTLREGGLLKLKRFADDEAQVIGAVELQHNKNEAYRDELGRTKRSSAQEGKEAADTLGALVCVTRGGVEFQIGTGFSAELRERLWRQRDTLPGQYVKYKHLPHGEKTAPRHPVFLAFRDEADLVWP